MHGLRKLLVIGVTLGLYGSVVAPAHADTIITYGILPDDAGITVQIRDGNQIILQTQTDLSSDPRNPKFSIGDVGLQEDYIAFYDFFMPFIGPGASPNLLFLLSASPSDLLPTAYVWVHDGDPFGLCTELCTVIDFGASTGLFSTEDLLRIKATNPLTFFTATTGGLQDIGGYVNDVRGEISFRVQSDTGVVPLPAALPLFAGGLGLMGWLGRRKKPLPAHQAVHS